MVRGFAHMIGGTIAYARAHTNRVHRVVPPVPQLQLLGITGAPECTQQNMHNCIGARFQRELRELPTTATIRMCYRQVVNLNIQVS